MRDKFWHELTQIKHNVTYTVLYLERQKRILKIFNISILFFSAAGIMGLKFWDSFPLIACIIVTIISLFKLIMPQLIMSERNLLNLDKVHLFYSDQLLKFEQLWFEFNKKIIDENQLSEKYFELAKNELEINKILNDMDIYKPKNLVKKTKKICDNYFLSVYKVKSN